MAIIPVLRCNRIKPSIDFYTTILDFKLADDDGDDKLTDPAFVFLRRAGDLIALSSYGDGPVARSVVMVPTEDVDPAFDKFLRRGLKLPKQKGPVHQGPTDQTWGTREFYVDDPDGNTLAFTQTISP